MITFFPYPLITGLALLGLALYRSRARGPLYLGVLALFGVYLLALAAVVYFPIYMDETWPTRQEIAWQLGRANLVPFDFRNLFSMPLNYAVREIGGNILLTIPFGVGMAFLRGGSWRQALLMGVGVGLALEGVQLMFTLSILSTIHSSLDINDVILNAVGVVIGYGVYRLFAWGVRGLRVRSLSIS